MRDDEPRVGGRDDAHGAGHSGGSLLLGRDPPVGLLELLLLDASQEAEQLEARDRFGPFDSRRRLREATGEAHDQRFRRRPCVFTCTSAMERMCGAE
ncbi:hypothetical protein [Streptomyces sp. V1I6]|uniref:hypothetical protein n=1 Tax=Streptomyces sp. V1I6 TaxID=3042273 RepID=UPI002781B7DC|nr:hypothetical protein [Streptomyces sp. V1I6]MDQ0843619.1 hypothetical protein [Streptomyces sp. V1I6]